MWQLLPASQPSKGLVRDRGGEQREELANREQGPLLKKGKP
jgi:hypothetical protein